MSKTGIFFDKFQVCTRLYHRKRPKCVERAVLLDIPPLYNCVRDSFDTSDDISVVLLEGNTRYHVSLIGTEEKLMIYR